MTFSTSDPSQIHVLVLCIIMQYSKWGYSSLTVNKNVENALLWNIRTLNRQRDDRSSARLPPIARTWLWQISIVQREWFYLLSLVRWNHKVACIITKINIKNRYYGSPWTRFRLLSLHFPLNLLCAVCDKTKQLQRRRDSVNWRLHVVERVRYGAFNSVHSYKEYLKPLWNIVEEGASVWLYNHQGYSSHRPQTNKKKKTHKTTHVSISCAWGIGRLGKTGE